MSKTVDERIVQMQFQNSSFEKNIQTSMASINKLNESLNLTGASKGLESVSSAAKNLDMSGVSESVGILGSKFSALEVIGVTALANITNSAINAGKRIASALTIDPIKAGFGEYELKMDSIKTIMASTGEELETVKGYLEELNEYSDQTIYSFSDMTQNIGKFTNAGVELKDAVAAIKGIANEAALSGANANEASRAMYNFAQALSSGYVKLIDWKSIELANMATVGFKKELIATAVELGTLVEVGDKYKSTTTDANGRVSELFNSTQMFNDSLSSQWMTTEVLTETLKKYTDTSTKIGQDATAAATQVTKLSQAFDVMKETAQSGWAKTWEIIFGDLEQAKVVFTRLTNFVTGIIDGMNDARNAILEGALGGNPFSNLMGKLDSSGLSTLQKYSDATKKLSGDLERYQNIVDKVWNGDYKNSDTGRYELLDADGYDHKVIQDLVNKGYQYKLTLEDVAASQEKFGVSASKASDAVGEVTVSLEDLTDEQLKNAGLTDEEIKMFRELGEEAKRTGVPLKELLESMSKVDGRTHLIEAFANLGKTISKVFGAIKNAWAEVFPSSSAASTLYSILEGFHNLTDKLLMSDETADKLKRTFAGAFSVLAIGVDVVKKVVGLAAKVIGLVLDGILPMGGGILGVTAVIGDFIVGFRKAISSVEGFKEVMGSIGDKIGSAVATIRGFITKVIDVAKSIKSFDDFKQVGSDMISGLITGIKDGASKVIEPILTVGRTLLTAIKDFFGINSPSLVFMAIGGFIIAGLVAGLKDTSSVSEAFSGVFSVVETFVNGVVTIVKYVWSIISPVVTAIGDMLASIFKGIGDAAATGDLSAVFDAIDTGLLATIVVSIKKFIDSLTSITGGAGGIFTGIKDVLDGVKGSLEAYQNAINAEALMDIAKAVVLLVIAMAAISFLDSDKIVNGLAAMGGIMLELGLLVKESRLSTIGPAAGTGILLLSVALLILAGAVAIFGHMSLDTIAIGLIAMYGVLEAVSGALTKFANTKGIFSAGVAISLVAGALITLSGALFLMGSMSLTTIVQGLLAMSVTLTIVVDSLNSMNAQKVIQSSFAIGLVANALVVMSGALAIMGNLELSTIIKGLVAMAGTLTIVTTALNKVKTGTVLKNASAFVLMGIAMITLAGALAAMGSMRLETIGKGLFAMGGALAELVIALNLMKGTLAGSAALLVAAAALALLTPVLITLGMSAPVVAIGLIALAGAFLVLGLAGLVLSPLTPILLALGGAIALVGIGMGSFGAGVLALATGLGLLTVMGAPAAQALKLVFQGLIDLIPYAIESVGKGLVLIANVIKDSASSIGEAIKAVVLELCDVLIACTPPLLEALGLIILGICDLIIASIPSILEATGLILAGLLDLLDEAIVDLFELLGTTLDELFAFILEYVPKAADTALSLITAILQTIADNLDDIVASALEVVASFIDGVAEGLPDVIDSAFKLIISFINGLADAIRENNQDLINAATNLIDALIEAVGNLLWKVFDCGKNILNKVIEGISSLIEDIKDVAGDVIGGFVQGLKDGWENVKDAVGDFCGSVKDKVCDLLGISSPSKVFMEYGGYCVEGFAIGLKKLSGMAGNAAKSVAENVVDSFGNPMLQISDAIANEISAEPTIRPVLDLSNVRDGAKAIGGMLASKTLSINAQPIAALAASMANNQNGYGNDDVVSAINGLRKDLAENPRTVNHINGVTYDDGSNIVSAVETIVRAANIGRRV